MADPPRSAAMTADIWCEDIARHYDDDVSAMSTPQLLDATAAFLAEEAAGGAVLEFAIGTGRVALPLIARGVPVQGVDQSPAMVDQLRGKPGGSDVPVAIGDMADIRVSGEFTLVYLVFNTVSNLLTQDEQVACFRNAARHLRPGGAFVVELGVPELRRLTPGDSALVFDLGADHVGVDTYDVARQLLTSHHYWVGKWARPAVRSHHRYILPAELDLMGALAGMHLAARWSDWNRHPFTADSRSHISVYRTLG